MFYIYATGVKGATSDFNRKLFQDMNSTCESKPIKYISYSTSHTVYPKKYAHGFVVLCFVVVMQSFIMNSHEVFIHIHQGCFAGTGAIVRLPQCQWSKPDGYGKISQCITTTKHSKAKTVCIFLGIYCKKHSDYIYERNKIKWSLSRNYLYYISVTGGNLDKKHSDVFLCFDINSSMSCSDLQNK